MYEKYPDRLDVHRSLFVIECYILDDLKITSLIVDRERQLLNGIRKVNWRYSGRCRLIGGKQTLSGLSSRDRGCLQGQLR